MKNFLTTLRMIQIGGPLISDWGHIEKMNKFSQEEFEKYI